MNYIVEFTHRLVISKLNVPSDILLLASIDDIAEVIYNWLNLNNVPTAKFQLRSHLVALPLNSKEFKQIEVSATQFFSDIRYHKVKIRFVANDMTLNVYIIDNDIPTNLDFEAI